MSLPVVIYLRSCSCMWQWLSFLCDCGCILMFSCISVCMCVFSQHIVWIVKRQRCVVLGTLGCDGTDSVWSIAVVQWKDDSVVTLCLSSVSVTWTHTHKNIRTLSNSNLITHLSACLPSIIFLFFTSSFSHSYLLSLFTIFSVCQTELSPSSRLWAFLRMPAFTKC